MISWNSLPLEIAYQVLKWTAFFLCSISFYPQVFLNFHRIRVVGLNFDFVVLNLTKHSSYLIYNATLYFSSTVQKQYRQKYGLRRMIPVAASGVAFYIHAVLLTAITLFQIGIYDRGLQKVSKICRGIVSGVWAYVAICFFKALPTHSWLWLISAFNFIRVYMMLIKYIPQAYMNFRRKSTDGFSIGNILLGFCGWIAKYRQMTVQSIDQNSWVNFYGNIGYILLSLISIFFEIVFMCQHFLLYPAKKALISAESSGETNSEDVSIQVFMTVIKYIPQAYMNFGRKSTDGFSIGNILLDFCGGMANYGQMTVQSIDQNSWVNFYGNIGKTLLSLISIFFDILFMCQHFLLYPAKNALISAKVEKEKEGAEPFIKSSGETNSEDV